MLSRREFFRRVPVFAFIPFISTLPAGRKSAFFFADYIAGFRYYDGEKAVRSMKKGDPLVMKREPRNPYDQSAVEIYTRDGAKLGYMPRHINPIPASLLDQNMKLEARVAGINLPPSPPWERVRFAVFQFLDSAV